MITPMFTPRPEKPLPLNIPKECKPQKNASVFDDKYTEYESEVRKELSIEQYLDEF